MILVKVLHIRAYQALYLGGTPSQETGTSPSSCLLLENRLYMNEERKKEIKKERKR